VIVNENVPGVDGVPLTTPAPERVSPPGRTPLVTEYAYGGAPPLEVTVCEYAMPTVPPGSDPGATVIAAQPDPPVEVRMIVPTAPTALPVLSSTKETLRRSFATPLTCAAHDDPPFVVRTIVPPAPTAVPTRVDENLTARRF
jgi:hypothetical protein